VSNKNIIAFFIAVAMGVWLFSGELASNIVIADEATDAEQRQEVVVPYVRAVRSEANLRKLFLEVSGQTQANRIVQVKSEVTGRVEAIPAVKGTRVEAGDLLCKIAVDTRQSDLDEAKADLKSAQLEYDGMVDLKTRGLQSEILLARAAAGLEGSRANVKRAELTLVKTLIVAPFNGVVETQSVEVGDFLNVGQNCVTLMEIDPVLVVGQVAEKSINSVALGGEVKISLITGESLVGTVSFIAQSPDLATRTYPVEVTVSNPNNSIRAGLTAQMSMPIGQEAAHRISPASLVLNDAGAIGVKIVDDTNIVHFKTVKILGETPEGVWVHGLPGRINLITVGHEEVFDGQRVKADLSPLGSFAES